MEKENFQFNMPQRLTLGALLVILFGLLVSLLVLGQTDFILNQRSIQAKEAARPANLELTVIQDSTCSDCFNLTPILEAIKKENVQINSEKVVELNSPEGFDLISKFTITKVPALVVLGEVTKIPTLKDLLSKLGELQSDRFILRQVAAPYVDTQSGDVRGRVKVTLLTDKSCQECYDVNRHTPILASFGLPLTDQQVVDVSFPEGKEMIKKYQIESAPTLVLSGDLEVYSALNTVWPKVGTIEADGTYVFRTGVSEMGVYRNLTNGQIIRPATTTPPANN